MLPIGDMIMNADMILYRTDKGKTGKTIKPHEHNVGYMRSKFVRDSCGFTRVAYIDIGYGLPYEWFSDFVEKHDG